MKVTCVSAIFFKNFTLSFQVKRLWVQSPPSLFYFHLLNELNEKLTSRLNQFSLKDKSDEPVNSQPSGGLWSWKMEIISQHADDDDFGFRYDSVVQVTLTALSFI